MTRGVVLALGFVGVAVVGGDARGAEVQVVPTRGALQPGLVTEVEVAVLDDAGRPLTEFPTVTASAGTWSRVAPGAQPGTWRFAADAPAGVGDVEVTVAWPSGSARRTVAVGQPLASSLEVRGQVHSAGSDLVTFSVVGRDLPAPTALQVVSSEGRVVRVERLGDRLEVQLEPDDRPTARLVVVGVRDARREALPAWGIVRLQASVDAPIETEPGARVELQIGSRHYGPVTAGPTGQVTLSFAQLPEESSAQLRVVDPAGNETTGTIPLSSDLVPRLVPFVTGPRYPGEPPPEVLLRAVRPDGRPWSRDAPTCRAPTHGELPVVRVEPGTWRLRLPADLPPDAWDVRVRCSLGEDVERSFSVPLAEGVPVALAVRVWPAVLSTDLPVADIQASLVNAAGERVPATGAFEATAGLGFVELDQREGPAVRGEYRADLAAEVGEDEVVVTWTAPPGEGEVDRLEVVGEADPSGVVRVYVRPLGGLRRPLARREVEVALDGRLYRATTDAKGWATVELPKSGGPARVIDVRAGSRQRQAVVTTAPGGRVGPGRPDLVAILPIKVDPGRVAEVDLQIVPRVVRPRTSATIRVRLLDRSGGTANAGLPELEVDEGTVRALGRSPEDAAWEWAYLPPAGFRQRTVEVRARSAELDVEAHRTLEVRPAPVDRWIGLSAGVQTEFERIVSPVVALDMAWRIRVGPRDQDLPPGRSRFFVRAGVGWFGGQTRFDVQEGVEGRIRMDLIPIHLGVVLRQEYPSQAWWVSLGGIAAPFVGSNDYNGVTVTRRVGILPPGLHATVGYGVRVPGGEVAFELRGTVLNSPGSDISYPGQVGGLAGTIGYRVFY